MAQTPINNPFLLVQQIQDQYVRKNFDSLKTYFNTQNQFLDFKFFEQVFTAPVTGFQLAHGLTYAPLDILVTRISGPGTVSFKYGSFTSSVMVMDVSGPCRIRFYAGTYSRFTSNVQAAPTDVQDFSAQPETVAPQITAPVVASDLPQAAYYVTTSGQSITGSPTKVLFDGKEYDDGDNFDVPNSRFIAPSTGRYSFTGYLTFGGTTGAVNVFINLYVQGSAYKTVGTGFQGGAAYNPGLAFDFDVALIKGQNVSIFAFASATQSIDGNDIFAKMSFLQIKQTKKTA